MTSKEPPPKPVTPVYDVGARGPASKDTSPISKAFQGDTSHLAGPGKGIQSVQEYKRRM